ncbi:hypothetical protein [Archaeoglobus profundus]|uniref:Uncharacterized protein n=1 Tax=Archaeoglobus profundus (strain DSM 5631 / JCM 9629 / NBRC 100127 / Av18) TaxID=572546 RepID=D2RI09_ARCPA|nr:hypothetical protein [Archaeoglobus profundus]ADB57934.1 hypothetical protein Arcpr_0871 [Archaeoglobus profundus DSM 5631]
MKEIRIRIPTPDEIVPNEFKEHMANAYKEILLALRCLIDESIKRIEEKKEKKLKKIEIQ